MSDKRRAVLEGLIEVATDVLRVPEGEISMDLKAGDLPNWDSLGHLRLFMAIEEKFGVKFTAKEILQLLSIEQICCAIEEKK
ncbi:MAG: acyl carrier protein [Nitrospirae bacterium]|nr:acyl carrier protein [Nitrospirota bacterium]